MSFNYIKCYDVPVTRGRFRNSGKESWNDYPVKGVNSQINAFCSFLVKLNQ